PLRPRRLRAANSSIDPIICTYLGFGSSVDFVAIVADVVAPPFLHTTPSLSPSAAPSTPPLTPPLAPTPAEAERSRAGLMLRIGMMGWPSFGSSLYGGRPSLSTPHPLRPRRLRRRLRRHRRRCCCTILPQHHALLVAVGCAVDSSIDPSIDPYIGVSAPPSTSSPSSPQNA
ncbi:hypothetical protein DFQ27_001217, partial [Actinomortierella ambigua]